MKKYLGLLFAFSLLLMQTSAFAAEGASLKLTSDDTTYKVGDTFTVNVMLDTAGAKTDEVDLVVKYDSTALEVKDGMPNVDGEQVNEENILLEVYLENEIDAPNGVIKIEQAALDPSKYYTSSGTAASLTSFEVRALKTGTATMTIEMTENDNENDSSIMNAETGEDVLAVVENLTLTIEASSDAAPAVDTEAPAKLAKVEMAAEKSTFKADGKEQLKVSITSLDEDDKPMASQKMLLSATGGATLSQNNVTTDADGKAQVTVTAPSTAGQVQIVATGSEDASVTSTINLTAEAVEIEESEVQPVENVSAGPDTLEDVGPGEIMVGMLLGLSLVVATYLLKKSRSNSY